MPEAGESISIFQAAERLGVQGSEILQLIHDRKLPYARPERPFLRKLPGTTYRPIEVPLDAFERYEAELRNQLGR